MIAVNSLGGSLRYLTKYLRKMYGRESDVNLTQALSWVYNKRVFSISKDFVKQLRLVYEILHNSNGKTKQITLPYKILIEKTKEKKISKTLSITWEFLFQLKEKLLSEWEFIGVYPEECFKELRNNVHYLPV